MSRCKDGYAYVGYEFGCTWDEEHGLGFMTYKDRIVDFGGADSAFLTWVARKDLKSESVIGKILGKLDFIKFLRSCWNNLFGS